MLLAVLCAPLAPLAHAGTQRLPRAFSMVPDYPVRAKDFAFIREGGYFHLFWMRNDTSMPYDSTERDLGHAVSRDLQNWTQLPPVLAARPRGWDNLHIWAPSILKRADTFYMYYTGVGRAAPEGTPVQRIGLATSTDLLNWHRADRPVLSGAMIPWVFSDSTMVSGCQFRDPFAMPDPATPGRTLLYYVSTPAADCSQLIVGVAQSTNLLNFADLAPLWATGASQAWGRCESPHVTEHNGLYYLFTTAPGSTAIRFRTATNPLADSTGWSTEYRLSDMADQDPVAGALFASEILSVPGHDYLAVVNALGYRIDIYDIVWDATPPGFRLATPVVAEDPPPVHTGPALDAITRTGPGPGVMFRASLPAASTARIDLFDIGGRRVLTLHSGLLPEGDSVVGWDGRLASGDYAPSGVYFAVLTAGTGRCVARVAVAN
jgi:beta-fructofuranosidase